MWNGTRLGSAMHYARSDGLKLVYGSGVCGKFVSVTCPPHYARIERAILFAVMTGSASDIPTKDVENLEYDKGEMFFAGANYREWSAELVAELDYHLPDGLPARAVTNRAPTSAVSPSAELSALLKSLEDQVNELNRTLQALRRLTGG